MPHCHAATPAAAHPGPRERRSPPWAASRIGARRAPPVRIQLPSQTLSPNGYGKKPPEAPRGPQEARKRLPEAP